MSAKQTVAFIEFNLNNQNLFNTEYLQKCIIFIYVYYFIFIIKKQTTKIFKK